MTSGSPISPAAGRCFARPPSAAATLERQWRSGTSPALEDFLAEWSSDEWSSSPAISARDLAELVRLDQRERWRRGQRPAAEEYLRRFPQLLSDDELALDVIYGEFLLREELGQDPKPLEYQLRFPEFAETLQDQIEFHHAMAANGSSRLSAPDTCRPASTGQQTGPAPTESLAPRSSFLGRFELLHEVGMGTFGAVWKARDSELERLVALKIPRTEQLTREERELFLREARSAAQLKHPNIVAMHEVGRDGETIYLVSDFVEGQTLAEWLKGQRPAPREAAALCIQIAGGLHHAHEAGVVHRDLKPANIMLSEAGGRRLEAGGRTKNPGPNSPSSFSSSSLQPPASSLPSSSLIPHIMDFGLAKREAAEATLASEGRVLGTPNYMPPEQARGQGHQVDRRGDVYSLGVILFEMLTGELPFRGDARMVLHQVIYEDPPSPRRFIPKIAPDLETICLKCLEKDPGRRYASAADLAEDLQRFLEDRPIVARPVSRREQMLRWCRRNPRIAALTGALALVLLAGAAVSTFFAVQATNNAEYYRVEKVRADAETAKALAALARESQALKKQAAALGETEDSIYRYVQAIKNNELLLEGRFKPLIDQLLAEAVTHYQRYIERHKDDRDAAGRAKLATALFEIASLNSMRGTTEATAAALDQAAAIQEQLMRDHPDVADYQHDLALTYHERANLLRRTGEPEQALATFVQAIALRERLVRAYPTVDEYRQGLFIVFNDLGLLHYQSSRLEDALAAYQRGNQVQESLAAKNPRVMDYQVKLASGYLNQGTIQLNLGNSSDALASYEKARAIQEQLVNDYPDNGEVTLAHSDCLANLAIVHIRMQQPEQALAAFEESVRLVEQVAIANPTIDQFQCSWARKLGQLGRQYDMAGRSADAQDSHDKAVAIMERLAREYSSMAEYQVGLAEACVGRSRPTAATRPATAAADLDRAIAILEQVLNGEEGNYVARGELRTAYMIRAELHEDARKFADAAAAWRRAADTDAAKLEKRTYCLRQLGLDLARSGQHEQAADVARGLKDETPIDDLPFDTARIFAMCAAVCQKDESLPPADRAAQAAAYAASALDYLNRAAEDGTFRDQELVGELRTRPEFDALRERAEFKHLLQEDE